MGKTIFVAKDFFVNKIFNLRSNKTLQNFLIYGSGQAVNLISPLIVTPYLIYICGLEKFGVIAIGQYFAYVLIVLVDYSSYIIGVKDVSVNRDNPQILRHIFVNTFASKILLLLIVLAISLLLIFIIPYFRAEALAIIISTAIIIAQAINPTWFLQGIEDFKWITFINILSKIIFITGIFIFITKPDDYIYANLWLGGGALAANITGYLYTAYRYNFSIFSASYFEVKKLIIKDFTFCISQLFLAIRNYSPLLIIGFIAGDYIAGQYRVIEQIINLLRTYLQMFFKFSYSYVCFGLDRDIKTGLTIWKKYNGLNFIFLCVLLALAYIFSYPILYFFKVGPTLAEEMQGYLRTAIFIPLLIGITLPMEQLIFGLNKNREYILLTVLSATACILGTAVVISICNSIKHIFLLLLLIELSLIASYALIIKKKLQ